MEELKRKWLHPPSCGPDCTLEYSYNGYDWTLADWSTDQNGIEKPVLPSGILQIRTGRRKYNGEYAYTQGITNPLDREVPTDLIPTDMHSESEKVEEIEIDWDRLQSSISTGSRDDNWMDCELLVELIPGSDVDLNFLDGDIHPEQTTDVEEDMDVDSNNNVVESSPNPPPAEMDMEVLDHNNSDQIEGVPCVPVNGPAPNSKAQLPPGFSRDASTWTTMEVQEFARYNNVERAVVGLWRHKISGKTVHLLSTNTTNILKGLPLQQGLRLASMFAKFLPIQTKGRRATTKYAPLPGKKNGTYPCILCNLRFTDRQERYDHLTRKKKRVENLCQTRYSAMSVDDKMASIKAFNEKNS